MRIAYEYSHFGGSEVLQVRYPDCHRAVYEVVASVEPRPKKSSVGREKTPRGPYSPGRFNQQFRRAFGAV